MGNPSLYPNLQPRLSLTWLASYPRSGNTLLRVILNRCFGLSSQSVYSDADFAAPALRALVGVEEVGADPGIFLARAQAQGRALFVKTHEAPRADNHKVLYVVRDGRSAVVSHMHYLRRLKIEALLGDVIAGRYSIPWSAHVNAWLARPGTLLLRYEKLAAGDGATLAALSDFIGRPQLQPFDIRFDALRAADAGFFRAGRDDANIAEMDGASAELFERLHGATLRALGYA